ncbi:hypothetical protein [Ancylobacter terrae]|uniref:hypothetical protein n=1 Tax=Ancylobacter sp. sgz301288 TaxID=3342077 RepID=UPI00385F84B0
MSTLLDEAIAKLKALPEDRQADAVALLDMFFAQGEARYVLTPEQVAEVEDTLRELDAGRMKVFSEEEMDEFWRRYGL